MLAKFDTPKGSEPRTSAISMTRGARRGLLAYGDVLVCVEDVLPLSKDNGAPRTVIISFGCQTWTGFPPMRKGGSLGSEHTI